MGVRIFYDDDHLTSEDDECVDCFKASTTATSTTTSASTASTTSSISPEIQQTLHLNFKQQEEQKQQSQQHQHSHKTINMNQKLVLNSKDVVGNSKKFRIENNKSNLRIIGNNNRIRIINNYGSLQIIGNNTRLKITKNVGFIKYTGNEGRIYLGNESAEQSVDYIGCNGLLTIFNSAEITNKSPKNDRRGNAMQCKSPVAKTTSTKTDATTSKVKSASHDELNVDKNVKWQKFNEDWRHFNKVSLPNLKESLYKKPTVNACNCKSLKKNNEKLVNKQANVQANLCNRINVVNNFNDVIISNAVNIRIA